MSAFRKDAKGAKGSRFFGGTRGSNLAFREPNAPRWVALARGRILFGKRDIGKLRVA